MKILVEGMTVGKGGKESYIINMYRRMAQAGHDFTFIAYDPHIAYEEEILSTGATIVHLPPRSAGLIGFNTAIKNLFENEKYDVLWSHKTTLSSCESLAAAKAAGVPVRIIHSHSSSNMGGRMTYLMHSINKRRILRIATDYLACSESAAKWFYPSDAAIIAKNGFEVSKYKFDKSIREAIRNKYNVQNKTVLGHVGRFSAEKNHIKLLDIFFAYNQRNPDSCLILCGDGEERKKIEYRIQQLGIEKKVILLGVVNNVHEILQGMDVIVMPSLFEGLPYALLEAQAAGLKCVVSDTVSKESDVLGWNSFLPLDYSGDEWAERIHHMDLNYDRSIAAEQLIKQGYDIDECVMVIEMIIRKGVER